jgi:8-oxo-dGTP pyrophosphatase MutT (NUDIX family)
VELTITLPVGDELFAYWQLVLSNRDAEVVLAAQRPSGRFLIHTKGEYPDGVYRLMSGGIGRDEDVLQAVHRELVEETGLDGQIARFVGILTTRFQHEGQELGFVSYLFHIRLSDGPLSPEDDAEDIIGFREVTLQELGELADELECLDNGFWRDWGRFRGAAHRLLVEELTA